MQANSCLHSETRKCNLINLAHNTSCTLVACFIFQIFQLHPNLLTRHTATHHNNIYNVFICQIFQHTATHHNHIYNVFICQIFQHTATHHNNIFIVFSTYLQHFTTFHNISQHFTTFHNISQHFTTFHNKT